MFRRDIRWVLPTAGALIPFVMHAAQLPSARAKTSLTALDRYVAAPDASFTWKAVRDLPADGVTATLLDMTSQKYLTEQEVERPLWTHWLTVIRPAQVTSDVGLLFITGGSLDRPAPTQPPAWLVEAAQTTGTVTAELRLVPNQPVVFKDDPEHKPRTEDGFIAYTWNKYSAPVMRNGQRVFR
jgi:PhoPQ-activated pathogenicity-related protein